MLVAFVVALLGAIAGMNRERIARNTQAWLETRLGMLLGSVSYDNDLLADTTTVISADQLGTSAPVTVYRARRNGEPVAAVLLPVAPDGYGGPLRLMVAIDQAGTVLGVQVLEHQETAGLGDAFATDGGTWFARFAGRSLANPPAPWAVRKDGGDFDQFTGATVTPRAIVKAVQRTLEYYQANREPIYASPAR